MTWNLEDNVTDLEDSKLLAELGVMEGVDADGIWDLETRRLYGAGAFDKQTNTFKLLPGFSTVFTATDFAPFYRLDKLLSVLPDIFDVEEGEATSTVIVDWPLGYPVGVYDLVFDRDWETL